MKENELQGLKEQFERLRPDVKAYLVEMCLAPADVPENIGDLRFYHLCKNNLSDICGWTAGEYYDQKEFDEAIDYVIRRLEV